MKMSSSDRSTASAAVAAVMSVNGAEYAIFGCAAVVSLYYCYYTHKSVASDEGKGRPPMLPLSISETMEEVGSHKVPEFILKVRKDLGTPIFRLNTTVPGGLYVVSSTKDQREIYMDKTTEKPVSAMKAYAPITNGDSLFSRATSDFKWLHSRKGSAPAFSSAEVRRMNEVCCKQTQRWIDEYLEPLCASEDPTFDPSEEIPTITFHVIMEAAFEYKATDEECHLFASNLETAFYEYALRQPTNPLRRLFGFLLPEVREAWECCKRVHAFGKKVLVAYRDNPNKSERNTLIKLIENNPNYESDTEKIADLLLFAIAGFDTVGYTLASVITLMAMYKDEQYKLRESLAKANDSIDNGMVKSSDYMHQVITESMRYRPVSAFTLFRKLGREYTFTVPSLNDPKKMHTYTIPKGASVATPQVLANRDPLIFEDPDVYRPDRWADASKDMVDAMIPFSVGNRNCAGQSLAKAEMYSVLPKIFLNYEFEIVDEGEMNYFLTWKCIGSRVRVKKAKSNE